MKTGINLRVVCGMAAGLVLAGCGDASGLGEAPEALAEQGQAIQNGSKDFLSFLHEKKTAVGLISAGGGACSGTLLRNNVVLTARHCVTTNNSFHGDVGDPARMRVVAGSVPGALCASYPAGTCQNVTSILAAPVNLASTGANTTNFDAALLVLAGRLNVDGDTQNVFSALDPYPAASHAGKVGRIVGMGMDFSDNDSSLYDLQHGAQTVTNANTFAPAIGSPITWRIMQTLDHSGTKTYVDEGDSGGAYWLRELAQPSLIGVLSMGHSGSETFSHHARVADVRYLFNKYIADNLSPVVGYGSFTTSTLASFEQATSGAGTAALWQVASGAIVQKNNPNKALLILNGKVYENVAMQVTMSGSDNDSMGAVIRYVDRDNYLLCEANDEYNYVRIVKRQWGNETELASTSWSGTFSTQQSMQFYASEKSVGCDFAGRHVQATQNQLVVGRVGMYNHFNDEGKFHNFDVGAQPAVNAAW